MNVFELNVAACLVFAFAWIELRNNAVANVSIVVDDQDVLHANILVVQQRLPQAADDLVEVLVALKTLETERDAGHDGLFLLDDHARVGADRSQVEVVLNAERETEHQRQQQEKPGSEASYLSRKLHAQTKRNVSASDVVALEELTHSAFIFITNQNQVPALAGTHMRAFQ